MKLAARCTNSTGPPSYDQSPSFRELVTSEDRRSSNYSSRRGMIRVGSVAQSVARSSLTSRYQVDLRSSANAVKGLALRNVGRFGDRSFAPILPSRRDVARERYRECRINIVLG